MLAVRTFENSDVWWAEAMVGSMEGRMQARRGEMIDVLDGDGLVAEQDGTPVGLLTYARRSDGVEIMYVEAASHQRGVGTALVDALAARTRDVTVWVVTTNDNLDALRFYQRRGFAIRAVRIGAVDDARVTLKPSIPLVGDYGIRIRDEVELERVG